MWHSATSISGGESLKGWVGTQVPALFFCSDPTDSRILALFESLVVQKNTYIILALIPFNSGKSKALWLAP